MSGVAPEVLLVGNRKQIFKMMVIGTYTQNYPLLTLVSCHGLVFTFVYIMHDKEDCGGKHLLKNGT